jgi:hypothetical protein
MQAPNSARVRLGAFALGISALLFLVFPLVRPFFADPDLNLPASLTIAAQGFTATAWVASHLMAMIALILLIFGLITLYAQLSKSTVERRVFKAMILGLAGIALILPTLGVELYALPAIGKLYLDGKTEAFYFAGAVRTGPLGFLMFLLGLLLLAIGAIVLAVSIWQSDVLPKWAGVAFAIGLALWFPPFPQIIRIVDGLLIGVGGIWLAWRILQNTSGASQQGVQ